MSKNRVFWAEALDSTNDSVAAVVAAGTSGGASLHSTAALAGTATTIKASAGNLYHIDMVNQDAAARFLQIFDAASPTVGTTTPDYVIELAASETLHLDFGTPLTFATAIVVAFTTTAGGATGATATQFSAAYK